MTTPPATEPAPLRLRYDVLSEPSPRDPNTGYYRAVAYHADGTMDVLYEGEGWEAREWAYTLAGRLEHEDREARQQPPARTAATMPSERTTTRYD